MENEFHLNLPIMQRRIKMMPTEQRCPSCGTIFIGSDAIGDVCDNCRSYKWKVVPFRYRS